MKYLLSSIALSLSIAGVANAHGYVKEFVANGQSYPGFDPNVDNYVSNVQRVVRHIPNDGPVTNIRDSSLACNVGGEKPAALVADAPAGGKITFQWTNWPADHLGPVSTYMAPCNGDCTKFDANGAKWFKIDAMGFENGQWASTKLINDGNSWTSTIPSGLASGDYLIRNEIVALHSAGAPQFYPMCAQVKVTGNGNANPSDSQTVSIPGLYDNVNFPDIWTDNVQSFPAPGPDAFTGSGGNIAVAVPSSPAAAPSSSAAAPSSSAASSSSGRPKPSTASSSSSSSASASSSASSPSSTGKCRSKSKRMVRHARRHH